VSDIPDLTFSMDADEEKHILYEKNEVKEHFILVYHVLATYKLKSKKKMHLFHKILLKLLSLI